MGRTWPAYLHYPKRQSVQLSNKHSYKIPLFCFVLFCFVLFPVTCYRRASQFHSIWDYKYNIDGRIVTKDKLEVILEEVILVHARYCPELLWRDWERQCRYSVLAETRLRFCHNTGLQHYRYINLPDICELAREQLCIIVWRADRARQTSWTDNWRKIRNGWWASKQLINRESRARLADNIKV